MKFSALLLSLFVAQILSAQSGAPKPNKSTQIDPEIQTATEALVAKYSLNADQAKQVYQIQKRKKRNMAEIAPLQTSDVALYQAKLLNVQTGTWRSIRQVLQTKEQVEIYRKTQGELRGLRNAKRQELTAQKAPREAVEAAVLAIYAE
jgi:hypothetical protein